MHCFYVCNVSTNSFNPIRSLQSCWSANRGQTQAEIARAIGVEQSLISRIWTMFLETGNAGRRPGHGRRLASTPNEDCYLTSTARRHRNVNGTLFRQHFHSATGTKISTLTVRIRLHAVSLYVRWPIVSVKLTASKSQAHREWVTEHVHRRRNELRNILFSEESRFSLHPDNRRIFIYKKRGTRTILRSLTKASDLVVVEWWWHLH